MRRVIAYVVLAAGSLAAALAWGGSRAAESAGAAPAERSACTSGFGVTLLDAESCRLSVRSADGGVVEADSIVSYYCDSSVGWVRSAAALDCAIERGPTADGGLATAFVCPDTWPLARYGRQGAALVKADGGTAVGTVRVECWGRDIP